MIFSLNYHSDNKKKAGEIRCPYNQLGTIIKFIKEYYSDQNSDLIDYCSIGMKSFDLLDTSFLYKEQTLWNG